VAGHRFAHVTHLVQLDISDSGLGQHHSTGVIIVKHIILPNEPIGQNFEEILDEEPHDAVEPDVESQR